MADNKLLLLFIIVICSVGDTSGQEGTRVRFSTFNASLYRRTAGTLEKELAGGRMEQAKLVAEIIQVVRPDVLLINEFDYDSSEASAKLFQEVYLQRSQNGEKPIDFRYRYVPASNTGIASGMDLNADGKIEGPGDAWGFGNHPGQYGMLVLSRFPIEGKKIRTFQSFRWKDMPGALRPRKRNGGFFHPDKVWSQLRLSSKNHCDVGIQIGDHTVHFLISHPTPPVFDGEEDRNGRRNHDEIRFWNDYVTAGKSGYIYDDKKRSGGLNSGDRFVIAGDLNADPLDGDSSGQPIEQLRKNPLIQFVAPASEGAREAAKVGKANLAQRGDPSTDTADFNDATVGNLRIDYVLPSSNLKVKSSGVFWPVRKDPRFPLLKASDHRLVWVDVLLAQ